MYALKGVNAIKNAIGVFDSGLGGLCAVRELMKLMPNEDIVYFGDTGRVPYGNRSPETIRKYAAQDVKFLLSHSIKAVVIACGTISSAALETVEEAAEGIPVIGVVEPSCIEAAGTAVRNREKTIGILGTAATISAGAYLRKLKEIDPALEVISRACPLFVPLVENGYTNDGSIITRLAAEEYLDGIADQNIRTIILGCTHYPMLTGVLSQVMPGTVFIDSGQAAARRTKELLSEHGLLNPNGGGLSVYVSDEVHNFKKIASRFLGFDIGKNIYKINIENY